MHIRKVPKERKLPGKKQRALAAPPTKTGTMPPFCRLNCKQRGKCA